MSEGRDSRLFQPGLSAGSAAFPGQSVLPWLCRMSGADLPGTWWVPFSLVQSGEISFHQMTTVEDLQGGVVVVCFSVSRFIENTEFSTCL